MSINSSLLPQYGNWALITGASSGIGRAFAVHLAKAKLNLILTARSEAKLVALSAQLKKEHGISTKVVATDLSQRQGVDEVIKACEKVEIGLLIANAGYGTSGKFLDSNLDNELNMLRLNCEALLILTHHFSLKMAAKKKGGILLLSSLVSFQGTPNAAHYAATKAYVQSLAEALYIEMKPIGIDVLSVAPGPVDTAFAKRANMQYGASISADEVAKESLRKLGRRSTVLPGRLTKFLRLSLRTVPRWAKVRIMEKVMSGMVKKS